MYSDLETQHEAARYWFFVSILFFALSFSVVAGVNAVVKPDMQGDSEIQLKVYAEYVAEIAGVDLYNDSDIDRPPPNPTTYEDAIRSLLLSSDEMQYRFSPDYIKIAKGFSDDMAQMFLNKLEAFDMKSTTQRTVHLDHVAGLDKINVRLMDAYKKLMETSMVGDKLRDLALKVMAGSIVNQLINSSRTLMPEQMGGTMFWRWIENGDLPFNFMFLHDIEGDMSIGTDTVTDVGCVVGFGDNKTLNKEKMDNAVTDYFDFFVDHPLMSSLYTHCWIVGLDPSNPDGDVNVTQVGSVFETQMLRFGTAMVLEERYGTDFGMIEKATSSGTGGSGGSTLISALTQKVSDSSALFASSVDYRAKMNELATKLVDMNIYYTLNNKPTDFLKQKLTQSFSVKDTNKNGKLDSGDAGIDMTADAKIPLWAMLGLLNVGIENAKTGQVEQPKPGKEDKYKEFISFLIAYPAFLLMNNPRTLMQAIKHTDDEQEFEKEDAPSGVQGGYAAMGLATAGAKTETKPKYAITKDDEKDKIFFWNIIGLFTPPSVQSDNDLTQSLDIKEIDSVMSTVVLTNGDDRVSFLTGQGAQDEGTTQGVDFFLAKKSVREMTLEGLYRFLDKKVQGEQKDSLLGLNTEKEITFDAVAVKGYNWWPGFGEGKRASQEGPYFDVSEIGISYPDPRNKPFYESLPSSAWGAFSSAKDNAFDQLKKYTSGVETPTPTISRVRVISYNKSKHDLTNEYQSWKGALAMAVQMNVFDLWNEFIPYNWQQQLAFDRNVYVVYARPVYDWETPSDPATRLAENTLNTIQGSNNAWSRKGILWQSQGVAFIPYRYKLGAKDPWDEVFQEYQTVYQYKLENPGEEYPGVKIELKDTDDPRTWSTVAEDFLIVKASGSFRKGTLDTGEPFYAGAYMWGMFDTLWACGIVSCLGHDDASVQQLKGSKSIKESDIGNMANKYDNDKDWADKFSVKVGLCGFANLFQEVKFMEKSSTVVLEALNKQISYITKSPIPSSGDPAHLDFDGALEAIQSSPDPVEDMSDLIELLLTPQDLKALRYLDGEEEDDLVKVERVLATSSLGASGLETFTSGPQFTFSQKVILMLLAKLLPLIPIIIWLFVCAIDMIWDVVKKIVGSIFDVILDILTMGMYVDNTYQENGTDEWVVDSPFTMPAACWIFFSEFLSRFMIKDWLNVLQRALMFAIFPLSVFQSKISTVALPSQKDGLMFEGTHIWAYPSGVRSLHQDAFIYSYTTIANGTGENGIVMLEDLRTAAQELATNHTDTWRDDYIFKYGYDQDYKHFLSVGIAMSGQEPLMAFATKCVHVGNGPEYTEIGGYQFLEPKQVYIYNDVNYPTAPGIDKDDSMELAVMLNDRLSKNEISSLVIGAKTLQQYIMQDKGGIIINTMGALPYELYNDMEEQSQLEAWLEDGGTLVNFGPEPMQYTGRFNESDADHKSTLADHVLDFDPYVELNGQVSAQRMTQYGTKYLPEMTYHRYSEGWAIDTKQLRKQALYYECYTLDEKNQSENICFQASKDGFGFVVNLYTRGEISSGYELSYICQLISNYLGAAPIALNKKEAEQQYNPEIKMWETVDVDHGPVLTPEEVENGYGTESDVNNMWFTPINGTVRVANETIPLNYYNFWNVTLYRPYTYLDNFTLNNVFYNDYDEGGNPIYPVDLLWGYDFDSGTWSDWEVQYASAEVLEDLYGLDYEYMLHLEESGKPITVAHITPHGYVSNYPYASVDMIIPHTQTRPNGEQSTYVIYKFKDLNHHWGAIDDVQRFTTVALVHEFNMNGIEGNVTRVDGIDVFDHITSSDNGWTGGYGIDTTNGWYTAQGGWSWYGVAGDAGSSEGDDIPNNGFTHTIYSNPVNVSEYQTVYWRMRGENYAYEDGEDHRRYPGGTFENWASLKMQGNTGTGWVDLCGYQQIWYSNRPTEEQLYYEGDLLCNSQSFTQVRLAVQMHIGHHFASTARIGVDYCIAAYEAASGADAEIRIQHSGFLRNEWMTVERNVWDDLLQYIGDLAYYDGTPVDPNGLVWESVSVVTVGDEIFLDNFRLAKHQQISGEGDVARDDASIKLELRYDQYNDTVLTYAINDLILDVIDIDDYPLLNMYLYPMLLNQTSVALQALIDDEWLHVPISGEIEGHYTYTPASVFEGRFFHFEDQDYQDWQNGTYIGSYSSVSDSGSICSDTDGVSISKIHFGGYDDLGMNWNQEKGFAYHWKYTLGTTDNVKDTINYVNFDPMDDTNLLASFYLFADINDGGVSCFYRVQDGAYSSNYTDGEFAISLSRWIPITLNLADKFYSVHNYFPDNYTVKFGFVTTGDTSRTVECWIDNIALHYDADAHIYNTFCGLEGFEIGYSTSLTTAYPNLNPETKTMWVVEEQTKHDGTSNYLSDIGGTSGTIVAAQEVFLPEMQIMGIGYWPDKSSGSDDVSIQIRTYHASGPEYGTIIGSSDIVSDYQEILGGTQSELPWFDPIYVNGSQGDYNYTTITESGKYYIVFVWRDTNTDTRLWGSKSDAYRGTDYAYWGRDGDGTSGNSLTRRQNHDMWFMVYGKPADPAQPFGIRLGEGDGQTVPSLCHEFNLWDRDFVNFEYYLNYDNYTTKPSLQFRIIGTDMIERSLWVHNFDNNTWTDITDLFNTTYNALPFVVKWVKINATDMVMLYESKYRYKVENPLFELEEDQWNFVSMNLKELAAYSEITGDELNKFKIVYAAEPDFTAENTSMFVDEVQIAAIGQDWIMDGASNTAFSFLLATLDMYQEEYALLLDILENPYYDTMLDVFNTSVTNQFEDTATTLGPQAWNTSNITMHYCDENEDFVDDLHDWTGGSRYNSTWYGASGNLATGYDLTVQSREFAVPANNLVFWKFFGENFADNRNYGDGNDYENWCKAKMQGWNGTHWNNLTSWNTVWYVNRPTDNLLNYTGYLATNSDSYNMVRLVVQFNISAPNGNAERVGIDYCMTTFTSGNCSYVGSECAANSSQYFDLSDTYLAFNGTQQYINVTVDVTTDNQEIDFEIYPNYYLGSANTIKVTWMDASSNIGEDTLNQTFFDDEEWFDYSLWYRDNHSERDELYNVTSVVLTANASGNLCYWTGVKYRYRYTNTTTFYSSSSAEFISDNMTLFILPQCVKPDETYSVVSIDLYGNYSTTSRLIRYVFNTNTKELTDTLWQNNTDRLVFLDHSLQNNTWNNFTFDPLQDFKTRWNSTPDFIKVEMTFYTDGDLINVTIDPFVLQKNDPLPQYWGICNSTLCAYNEMGTESATVFIDEEHNYLLGEVDSIQTMAGQLDVGRVFTADWSSNMLALDLNTTSVYDSEKQSWLRLFVSNQTHNLYYDFFFGDKQDYPFADSSTHIRVPTTFASQDRYMLDIFVDWYRVYSAHIPDTVVVHLSWYNHKSGTSEYLSGYFDDLALMPCRSLLKQLSPEISPTVTPFFRFHMKLLNSSYSWLDLIFSDGFTIRYTLNEELSFFSDDLYTYVLDFEDDNETWVDVQRDIYSDYRFIHGQVIPPSVVYARVGVVNYSTVIYDEMYFTYCKQIDDFEDMLIKWIIDSTMPRNGSSTVDTWLFGNDTTVEDTAQWVHDVVLQYQYTRTGDAFDVANITVEIDESEPPSLVYINENMVNGSDWQYQDGNLTVFSTALSYTMDNDSILETGEQLRLHVVTNTSLLLTDMGFNSQTGLNIVFGPGIGNLFEEGFEIWNETLLEDFELWTEILIDDFSNNTIIFQDTFADSTTLDPKYWITEETNGTISTPYQDDAYGMATKVLLLNLTSQSEAAEVVYADYPSPQVEGAHESYELDHDVFHNPLFTIDYYLMSNNSEIMFHLEVTGDTDTNKDFQDDYNVTIFSRRLNESYGWHTLAINLYEELLALGVNNPVDVDWIRVKLNETTASVANETGVALVDNLAFTRIGQGWEYSYSNTTDGSSTIAPTIDPAFVTSDTALYVTAVNRSVEFKYEPDQAWSLSETELFHFWIKPIQQARVDIGVTNGTDSVRVAYLVTSSGTDNETANVIYKHLEIESDRQWHCIFRNLTEDVSLTGDLNMTAIYVVANGTGYEYVVDDFRLSQFNWAILQGTNADLSLETENPYEGNVSLKVTAAGNGEETIIPTTFDVDIAQYPILVFGLIGLASIMTIRVKIEINGEEYTIDYAPGVPGITGSIHNATIGVSEGLVIRNIRTDLFTCFDVWPYVGTYNISLVVNGEGEGEGSIDLFKAMNLDPWTWEILNIPSPIMKLLLCRMY